MPDTSYNFPVYATQGGGLARRSGELFIFVEAPECPGYQAGDVVPAEWDIASVASNPSMSFFDEPMDDGEWFWVPEMGINRL